MHIVVCVSVDLHAMLSGSASHGVVDGRSAQDVSESAVIVGESNERVEALEELCNGAIVATCLGKQGLDLALEALGIGGWRFLGNEPELAVDERVEIRMAAENLVEQLDLNLDRRPTKSIGKVCEFDELLG
jgi:hypothetical protein